MTHSSRVFLDSAFASISRRTTFRQTSLPVLRAHLCHLGQIALPIDSNVMQTQKTNTESSGLKTARFSGDSHVTDQLMASPSMDIPSELRQGRAISDTDSQVPRRRKRRVAVDIQAQAKRPKNAETARLRTELEEHKEEAARVRAEMEAKKKALREQLAIIGGM